MDSNDASDSPTLMNFPKKNASNLEDIAPEANTTWAQVSPLDNVEDSSVRQESSPQVCYDDHESFEDVDDDASTDTASEKEKFVDAFNELHVNSYEVVLFYDMDSNDASDSPTLMNFPKKNASNLEDIAPEANTTWAQVSPLDNVEDSSVRQESSPQVCYDDHESFEDVDDDASTDTASETENFVDAFNELHVNSYEDGSNVSTEVNVENYTRASSEMFLQSTESRTSTEPFTDRVSLSATSDAPHTETKSAEYRYESDLHESDNEGEKDRLPEEEPKSCDIINNDSLKAQEALLSEEEKQARRLESRRLKDVGNERFREADYEGAIISYTEALVACLQIHTEDRAIIYANRSAAKMKLERDSEAIEDCSRAIELNPDYLKALLRRAELYEKSDKLDEALADYEKALERDPSLHQARAACMRLPDKIKERNEKMKEEMLGKLKDLGNLILRPFGLSTSNFQLQQDPNSGGYSIKFQQSGS